MQTHLSLIVGLSIIAYILVSVILKLLSYKVLKRGVQALEKMRGVSTSRYTSSSSSEVLEVPENPTTCDIDMKAILEKLETTKAKNTTLEEVEVHMENLGEDVEDEDSGLDAVIKLRRMRKQ